jgi:hypothetical protein
MAVSLFLHWHQPELPEDLQEVQLVPVFDEPVALHAPIVDAPHLYSPPGGLDSHELALVGGPVGEPAHHPVPGTESVLDPHLGIL